jgi:Protein of unknown function (DUF2726)
MLKRLLNQYEEATNEVLKPLSDKWGAHAFVKVKAASILPIERSGIDDSEFRFALQSEFDFVVTDDDLQPLFAVEFDGATHKTQQQQNRDRKKNQLCELFSFPLLRINSRYLARKYRQTDLLSWFINYWFADRMIGDAYDAGQIPAHEFVDPSMILSLPGTTKEFPLWLSGDVRCQIERLYEQRQCLDAIPSCFVANDSEKNHRAIAYIRITESATVRSRTAMRQQQFNVPVCEVLEAIATHDLYQNVVDVLEKRVSPISVEELARELDDFRARFQIVSSSTYGDPPTSRQRAI